MNIKPYLLIAILFITVSCNQKRNSPKTDSIKDKELVLKDYFYGKWHLTSYHLLRVNGNDTLALDSPKIELDHYSEHSYIDFTGGASMF